MILLQNPIGRTLKNASRLRTIVSVFAKHGFHQVAERVQLGRFVIDRFLNSTDNENIATSERIRRAFEELGPTFVKLGQVLATRPDLVPEDYVIEFSKLHDQVAPLSFDIVQAVLAEEWGPNWQDKVRNIDANPLGAASIAQVHAAELKDGTKVVIKVQRPGIIQVINDDLNVLYFLAELLDRYVPETRLYNPRGIVDEFFKTLELETNFIVEANNIRRFQSNFKDDPKIKVPQVYFDYTTEKVLVMEALQGIPLSQDAALKQPGIDPDVLVRTGLKAYMKMVFADGLFHGDLHSGNFFVQPDGSIGLIDFGVVGRLNQKTQASIANMLLALSKEDYERLAYEYVDLAPFTDRVNVDLFAKDLRQVIAPYYGLTLKNVNLGKILMSSASVAARHHLAVPTELMIFFKSLIAIEGLGRRIISDFDFLQYSLEVAQELVKHQYEPQKFTQEFAFWFRESRSLLQALPRQLAFLVRKLNSPNHAYRMRIDEITELKKAVQSSANLMFLGLVIGSLILGASNLATHPEFSKVASLPWPSFVGYMLAVGLGLVAFKNYIKKP